jgi:hypothetical protein
MGENLAAQCHFVSISFGIQQISSFFAPFCRKSSQKDANIPSAHNLEFF